MGGRNSRSTYQYTLQGLDLQQLEDSSEQLVRALQEDPPRRVRDLKPEIPDAPKILLNNVYGWFDRAERGIYVLTDAGRAALKRWPQHVPQQVSAAEAAH